MDPDQLASQKPAGLNLHCFQNWIYPLFEFNFLQNMTLTLLLALTGYIQVQHGIRVIKI